MRRERTPPGNPQLIIKSNRPISGSNTGMGLQATAPDCLPAMTPSVAALVIPTTRRRRRTSKPSTVPITQITRPGRPAPPHINITGSLMAIPPTSDRTFVLSSWSRREVPRRLPPRINRLPTDTDPSSPNHRIRACKCIHLRHRSGRRRRRRLWSTGLSRRSTCSRCPCRCMPERVRPCRCSICGRWVMATE